MEINGRWVRDVGPKEGLQRRNRLLQGQHSHRLACVSCHGLKQSLAVLDLVLCVASSFAGMDFGQEADHIRWLNRACFEVLMGSLRYCFGGKPKALHLML